ncbi:hypothetical protein ACOMHN_060927 [Nucella lapillus]
MTSREVVARATLLVTAWAVWNGVTSVPVEKRTPTCLYTAKRERSLPLDDVSRSSAKRQLPPMCFRSYIECVLYTGSAAACQPKLSPSNEKYYDSGRRRALKSLGRENTGKGSGTEKRSVGDNEDDDLIDEDPLEDVLEVLTEILEGDNDKREIRKKQQAH